MGTWSGVSRYLNNSIKSDSASANARADFGLIWIDAHFDLHNPETSPSKNFHGMSVSTLLGFGERDLVNIAFEGNKIKPENMVFIAIRSFENAELELAKKLGIKVYFAEKTNKVGFHVCINEAIKHFKQKNIMFGISFDMDCIDKDEITATGTPVKGGLSFSNTVEVLKSIDKSNLIAFEIVEYNPKLDLDFVDLDKVIKIISCIDKNVTE